MSQVPVLTLPQKFAIRDLQHKLTVLAEQSTLADIKLREVLKQAAAGYPGSLNFDLDTLLFSERTTPFDPLAHMSHIDAGAERQAKDILEEAIVGEFADHDPAQGAAIDLSIATGADLFPSSSDALAKAAELAFKQISTEVPNA